MKKIIALLAFVGLLASCDNELSIEYMPFRDKEDGNWGMISKDGDVLFTGEFKHEPTVAMHGRYWAKNGDGKWELYGLDAKPEQIGKTQYDQAGAFIESVAPVVEHGKPIQFVDKDGEVKVTLGNVDGQQITECTNFCEGLAAIKAGKYYGFVDKSGDVVIKPEYVEVCMPNDGKIVAIHKKYEKYLANDDEVSKVKYTVLSTSGSVLSEVSLKKDYNIGGKFSEGVMVAYDKSGSKSQAGLVDVDGEWVLRPSSKVRDITEVLGGKFIFFDGDGYGVMDFDGNVLIRPKYKALHFAFKKDYLFAREDRKDSQYTLIDMEENQIGTDEYYITCRFYGKYAAVMRDKNNWIFINSKGEDQNVKTDIYNIDDESLGDTRFYSQYVDVNALVNSFNLGKDGMLGLTVGENAENTVATMRRVCDGSVTDEARGYVYNQSVSGRMTLSRININVDAIFDDYIAEAIEEQVQGTFFSYSKTVGHKFKDIKPSQISVMIKKQDLLDGKMSELTTAFINKVKSLGKVLKENKNAVLVSVGQQAYFVANAGTEIYVVYGNLDTDNIDISAYQNVEEGSPVDTSGTDTSSADTSSGEGAEPDSDDPYGLDAPCDYTEPDVDYD